MCSFILSLILSPVFDYMHGGERPGEGNILGRGMSWGGACPGEGHVLRRAWKKGRPILWCDVQDVQKSFPATELYKHSFSSLCCLDFQVQKM